MTGWVLVGEKSADIWEMKVFIDTFEQAGVNIEKVFAKDIAVIADSENKVFINGKEKPLPDFAVAAFFGDFDYHNLFVVKMLEGMGIHCINSYDCLKDARDKLKAFHMVKENVPEAVLPKTMLYDKNLPWDFITSNFSFPLIAKINHGAKGIGVTLANDINELKNNIEELEKEFQDQILIQQYIHQQTGRDLRFIVCGGEIISCFTRTSQSEGFKSNLSEGGSLEFFNPSPELSQTALKTAQALSLNLGSVDFLFGENDTFYLCELNSLPGLSYVVAARNAGKADPLAQIAENIKKQVIARN